MYVSLICGGYFYFRRDLEVGKMVNLFSRTNKYVCSFIYVKIKWIYSAEELGVYYSVGTRAQFMPELSGSRTHIQLVPMASLV